MSDINRMLDDLLDTQPHRSDLRQNIVEAFESLSAQLAEERKHSDQLVEALNWQLDHPHGRGCICSDYCIDTETALAAHAERTEP